jgi:hypothetical protein
VSDDSVVLHYTYSTAEEVAAKANRSCPAEYLEAARRGDMAKVSEVQRLSAVVLLGARDVS